jgi:dihydroorotate dehydrogenase (NAD+) catalytic subunit
VSAEDALEFILVGAHAVQVGTGSFTSTDFAFSLADKMERLAKKLKIEGWSDFRGRLDTSGE